MKMRSELLASLLIAGVVLSGCQSGDGNGTSEHAVSNGYGSSTTVSSDRQSMDEGHYQEDERADFDDNDAGDDAEDTDRDYEEDGDPGARLPSDVSKIPDGWYMRTVATAITAKGQVYIHKTAGVFGELKESKDGLDKHDINALGRATLYVVFPKVKEEGNIEDYFSDYHHYDPDDQNNAGRQKWTFQVKNESGENLSHAAIRLSIGGVYKVYKQKMGYKEVAAKKSKMLNRLSLVDVDNQKIYSYSELKDADLHMDGKKVRTFRWVLGDSRHEYHPDEADRRLLQRTVKQEMAQRSQALQRSTMQPGSRFGLPPVP